MNRLIPLLVVALLLAGCAITHYEARGPFGETAVVLHWKEGDSALTLWRCGALPIPLTRGVQGQDDTVASNDRCITVLGDLEVGKAPSLGVHCPDPRYPGEGEYPLSAVVSSRQQIWFGLREPAIPDPCLDP